MAQEAQQHVMEQSRTPSPRSLASTRKAALMASRIQSSKAKAPSVQPSISPRPQPMHKPAPSLSAQPSRITGQAQTKQQIMNKAQGGRVKTFVAASGKRSLMLFVSGGTWVVIKPLGKSKVASAIMDLAPFLGGVKQLSEAVDGETTTGQKLTGKKRLIHGIVGVGSFALDLTGLGEGAKGAKVIGKSLGLVKGAAGKLAGRGAIKSAALLEKSAVFMAKNPELVRMAENVAEKHIDDGIRLVKSASRDDARKTLKEEASKYLPPSVADALVDAAEGGMRKKVAGMLGRQPLPAEPGILPSARKAALMAAKGMKPLQIPPPQSGQPVGEDSAQQAQAQQAQRLAWIQAGVNAQTRQQQAQSQQTQQSEEKTRQQREEIKKVAKAAVRRGAIFVTNSIASAFDLGSSGISFLINIFIYMFTLGWLNLEMIYGRYFMKGKSKYVGPLSWDPIPMPVDKNAIILAGFVVAADIALGIAALVLTFSGFCILHDMVKVTSSVTQAVSIGASIAQGEAGGLCLGGIITSAFGL